MQDVQQPRIVLPLADRVTFSVARYAGGFEVRGQIDGKPLGRQKTFIVGDSVTRLFSCEQPRAYMDGISITGEYRGQGLARLFVCQTVQTFADFGGVHFAGLTHNELKLEHIYRELGYTDAPMSGRRATRDDVDIVQKWLYRDFGKH